MSDTILEVQNLSKHFIASSGLINKTKHVVRAVDGINLSLRKGESFGLVGESGCGKSTLGRTIIQLYTPTSGSIRFHGKDLTHLSANELRSERKRIQMIFQDPYSSLDPRMTIGQALAEPFQIHGLLGPKEREARIKNLLELVSLRPSVVNRYPHEFSGGQRQRIAVARALALEPELIICDEPVSALDVSIQAQILNLLKDLQERLKLTYLFISHDLSVIEYFCDRIAVMYLGRIVEMADREELFARSNHPYTRALIKAVPEIGGGKKMMKKALAGEVPSPLNPPSGCTFHPRCAFATEQCKSQVPTLSGSNPDHQFSCFNPILQENP